MSFRAKVFLISLSLGLLILILHLVRKRQLKIEHSILWLVISSVIFITVVWQDLADRLAYMIGIDYPPALFFVLAIFFGILMLLHFSIEISKLKGQNKTLNQESSLNRLFIQELEKKHDSSKNRSSS